MRAAAHPRAADRGPRRTVPAAKPNLDDGPSHALSRHGRGERIAAPAVHVPGLAAGPAGCAWLAAAPQRTAGLGTALAIGHHAAGLPAMLGRSALRRRGRRRTAQGAAAPA
jgi:hypothetical protein